MLREVEVVEGVEEVEVSSTPSNFSTPSTNPASSLRLE
jgi:hypothetical protein